MWIDFSSKELNLPVAKNEFENSVLDFLNDWMSVSETIQVKTSGSTGKPKVLEIDKQRMRNSARMTGDFLNLKTADSALLCLPVSYIAGKMMLIRAEVLKLRIRCVSPNDSDLIQKALTDDEYNFSAMVPLQVEKYLDKISSVENLLIGGAAVSLGLKSKLKDIESKLFETYGMTETVSHIAMKSLNDAQSYFKILPHVKIELQQNGCLQIDAPKISSQTVLTNDLVEIISDHEFRFLGRLDNVINSGGVKIFPEEIEQILKPYIQTDFFVAGVFDEKLGEKLVLITESQEVINIDFDSIIENKYHRPKQVFCVSKFIRTESGKIRRKQVLFALNLL